MSYIWWTSENILPNTQNYTLQYIVNLNDFPMQIEKFSYDNKIVKYFAIATVVWGTIGMLVGIIIATLMFYPDITS